MSHLSKESHVAKRKKNLKNSSFPQPQAPQVIKSAYLLLLSFCSVEAVEKKGSKNTHRRQRFKIENQVRLPTLPQESSVESESTTFKHASLPITPSLGLNITDVSKEDSRVPKNELTWRSWLLPSWKYFLYAEPRILPMQTPAQGHCCGAVLYCKQRSTHFYYT